MHPKDTNDEKWSMINAKNQFGNAPLHAAAMAGAADVVRVMLEAGANVNALNNVRQCRCIYIYDALIRMLLCE